MAGEPLFGGRVPKRRRTGPPRTAGRSWFIAQPPEPDEESVLSDEQEVALALAGLANAPGFAPREEASDASPAPVFQPRRRGGAASGAARPRDQPARDQPAPYVSGPIAGDAGILQPHGAGSFAPRAQPAGTALLARGEPLGTALEPPLPAPELPPGIPKPAFGKRSASHVYIARFIEQQTNKTRLQQQAQQWNGNGFGGGAHLHEAELAERLPGGNGFARPPPPHTLPEPAGALPHAQELPSVSGAHAFPGSHGFPGAGPGPAGLQIPPAYAHLFSQQQPGAFPFPVPPGQLGGAMGGQQQQAALAQALAGASRFFSPYSMQLLNGGIAQQLAAMAGLPIPSGAPSPSLPLPLPMPKGHAELPKLANGAGLKPEDLPKALQALPPAALAGVDLERLRTMLPPGFLDQGRGDSLAGLKAPPGRGEQLDWGSGANGLPTRM